MISWKQRKFVQLNAGKFKKNDPVVCSRISAFLVGVLYLVLLLKANAGNVEFFKAFLRDSPPISFLDISNQNNLRGAPDIAPFTIYQIACQGDMFYNRCVTRDIPQNWILDSNTVFAVGCDGTTAWVAAPHPGPKPYNIKTTPIGTNDGPPRSWLMNDDVHGQLRVQYLVVNSDLHFGIYDVDPQTLFFEDTNFTYSCYSGDQCSGFLIVNDGFVTGVRYSFMAGKLANLEFTTHLLYGANSNVPKNLPTTFYQTIWDAYSKKSWTNIWSDILRLELATGLLNKDAFLPARFSDSYDGVVPDLASFELKNGRTFEKLQRNGNEALVEIKSAPAAVPHGIKSRAVLWIASIAIGVFLITVAVKKPINKIQNNEQK